MSVRAMLAEDFHKSVEGFMEKNASESGDFGAGCGRLWIYQQNVNLSAFGQWGIAITNHGLWIVHRSRIDPHIVD